MNTLWTGSAWQQMEKINVHLNLVQPMARVRLVLRGIFYTEEGAISLEARSGSSYAPIHPHLMALLLREHALPAHRATSRTQLKLQTNHLVLLATTRLVMELVWEKLDAPLVRLPIHLGLRRV